MFAAPIENSATTYDDLHPEDLDGGSGIRFLGESPAVLQAQMQEYAKSGDSHFGQRVMAYAAALALASFYYDPRIAILCLALIVFSETLDVIIHKRVFSRLSTDLPTVRKNFALLVVSSLIGSFNVVFYALAIAISEQPATHFMAFFFLFSASIFTALNDHQVVALFRLRLALYGGAFLAIPILDILRTGAGLHSAEWNQLFTSLFVLFFLVEISRAFAGIYRQQQRQMVELRDRAEKAKVASRAKTEFLSVMSHELRTPMTSINGAVGLAMAGTAGPLTPALENLLGIAQSNCKRLSKLISDILDLQKIEAGKMEFRSDPIELRHFLERACEVNRYYASSLNVSYEAVSDVAEGAAIVTGDEQRLDQVMSNLLSNAAKFSPSGATVTVRLSVRDRVARIEVIDRGVGLAEDKRDLVFDQFSQIDSSDNRKIGGTGLGMNISRQIVQAHGGTIDFRKNPGPGTTFFIELPLAEV